jgi:hypothetical protein
MRSAIKAIITELTFLTFLDILLGDIPIFSESRRFYYLFQTFRQVVFLKHRWTVPNIAVLIQGNLLIQAGIVRLTHLIEACISINLGII